LAAEWAKTGISFRVVSRSEEHLRRDFSRYGELVEYCAADLADPRAAFSAAQGVDTIFYCVGAPYTQFHLHPQLTRTALDAAVSAGVSRFILQGTVYPFGMPRRNKVDETHPREPHTYKGRMRKEQEDLVLEANGRSGLRTTILRAPDFYGPESELSYVSDLFKAAIAGRRASVIGPIDVPHEFIFVPDLARALTDFADKEEAYGTAWNVGGPGLITIRRFAELVFAAAGRKPKLRVANRTMLRLAGLFSPFMREVAEMHYLWTNPVELDDTRLGRLLPGLRKTSYEDGVRATVEAMKGRPATRTAGSS
jgi:nucleoside-diphosphate-sugar epimerase